MIINVYIVGYLSSPTFDSKGLTRHSQRLNLNTQERGQNCASDTAAGHLRCWKRFGQEFLWSQI